MLRQLFIGEMKVPVPVPVHSLNDAMDWIGKTLLDKGSVVTSMELNQHAIALDEEGFPAFGDRERVLNEESLLKICVDSPVTLALESLDAIRELAAALQRSTPKVAVVCWQHRIEKPPAEYVDFCEDLNLMVELLEHVHALMDRSHLNLAATCALAGLLVRMIHDLKSKQKNGEWKECAKTLVDRLELWLRNLITETENLHIQLMAENPLKTSATQPDAT
ncbi:MAG: hypothetical protein AB8C84_03330 [Oligoflexales bacterium]